MDETDTFLVSIHRHGFRLGDIRQASVGPNHQNVPPVSPFSLATTASRTPCPLFLIQTPQVHERLTAARVPNCI